MMQRALSMIAAASHMLSSSFMTPITLSLTCFRIYACCELYFFVTVSRKFNVFIFTDSGMFSTFARVSISSGLSSIFTRS